MRSCCKSNWFNTTRTTAPFQRKNGLLNYTVSFKTTINFCTIYQFLPLYSREEKPTNYNTHSTVGSVQCIILWETNTVTVCGCSKKRCSWTCCRLCLPFELTPDCTLYTVLTYKANTIHLLLFVEHIIHVKLELELETLTGDDETTVFASSTSVSVFPLLFATMWWDVWPLQNWICKSISQQEPNTSVISACLYSYYYFFFFFLHFFCLFHIIHHLLLLSYHLSSLCITSLAVTLFYCLDHSLIQYIVWPKTKSCWSDFFMTVKILSEIKKTVTTPTRCTKAHPQIGH